MQFGDKLKGLREQNNISQKELAKLLNVSLRTITSWEKDGRLPRNSDIYMNLAKIFNKDVSYFFGSDEMFVTTANEEYGKKGADQAESILRQTAAMFAGGGLSDNDKVAFMDQIQELYLDSKKKAKKFTPKKYLKSNE